MPPRVDEARHDDGQRERLGLRGRQWQADARLPQRVEDAQLPAHLHDAVARERLCAAERPPVARRLNRQPRRIIRIIEVIFSGRQRQADAWLPQRLVDAKLPAHADDVVARERLSGADYASVARWLNR